MTAITACRRCQVPVPPRTATCPWCGVVDPEPSPPSRAVTACWVVGAVGALAVTYELVASLGTAIG